jgi:hypothetical protein
MTYLAAAVSYPVDALSTDSPIISRRERNANVGYILFAFAVLWVAVVCAALIISPKSIPDCQLTALGEVAVCMPNSAAADPSHAGLNIADIMVPTSLSIGGYDAH